VRIFDLVESSVPRSKLRGFAEQLDLWDLRRAAGPAAAAAPQWPVRSPCGQLTRCPASRRSFKGQSAREASWNAATRLLPCLLWLRTYDVKKQLLPDCAAGLAVTFLIVPQGLSYAASIAGLPAIYGLCACRHLPARLCCACFARELN
jgi:hypothetical protein